MHRLGSAGGGIVWGMRWLLVLGVSVLCYARRNIKHVSNGPTGHDFGPRTEACVARFVGARLKRPRLPECFCSCPVWGARGVAFGVVVSINTVRPAVLFLYLVVCYGGCCLSSVSNALART